MTDRQKQLMRSLSDIKQQSDIKSFRVRSKWIEDDLHCAHISINGVGLDLWHYDSLGFLDYWRDSKKAFKRLLATIDWTTATYLEEAE